MTLDILQQHIKDIMNKDIMLMGADSVYEETDTGMILVISFHEITLTDDIIIHTKLIFPVDDSKTKLRANYFRYLYDFNCVYKQVNFDSDESFIKKLQDIFNEYKFGDDVRLLSDFIEAPSMFINDYFKKNNISEISVFDVLYAPKFKMVPCSETTFEFNITLNNDVDIRFIVFKKNKGKYITTFIYNDKNSTDEIDTLLNIHQYIGSKIIELINKKSED